MAAQTDRIDLLELDIDLRLANLWRETNDTKEWNLDVAAAFMRAAYGKGYCDAIVEDTCNQRAQLLLEHGYQVPTRELPPILPGCETIG